MLQHEHAQTKNDVVTDVTCMSALCTCCSMQPNLCEAKRSIYKYYTSFPCTLPPTSQWSTAWNRHIPHPSRHGRHARDHLAVAWPWCHPWRQHWSWSVPWSRRRRDSHSWCNSSTCPRDESLQIGSLPLQVLRMKRLRSLCFLGILQQLQPKKKL